MAKDTPAQPAKETDEQRDARVAEQNAKDQAARVAELDRTEADNHSRVHARTDLEG